MDISTFIQETLIALKNGLEGANKEAGSNDFVMFHNNEVDFDVAVTVLDKTEGNGKTSIGVASIVSLGGNISVENQNAKTSRIKFSVKIGRNLFGAAKNI